MRVSLRTMSEALPPPTTRRRATPAAALECRSCRVCCDRVVYPSACLERACPNLYCYSDADGRRFVGCLERVFTSELDLDLLEAATAGSGFGALRCAGEPLPICRTDVDRAYARRAGDLGCVNPEFFELPVGRPTFRVFAEVADKAP